MIVLISRPLKVSEVNKYIKRMFLGDLILSNIQVEGEISNYKCHYSGHVYFSLKDDQGKINCVLFKNYKENVVYDLKDGDKVIVTGYISVYEKDGSYQLYVKKVDKSGIGELYKAFEELKAKLEKEGLFDTSHKKELPFFPRKIGVVTSSSGAAIRDIITVIKRRCPVVDIVIYPVLVQGINAPPSICEGLRYLDKREDIDVIILGRGGGSLEELFAFNDENLARTIYHMKKPIISAVGHETDYTIADFVADLRAPTPSAAAEMATPDINEMLSILYEKYNRLVKSFLIKKNEMSMRLDYLYNNLNFHNPINKIRDLAQEQDILLKQLILMMNMKLSACREKIENLNRAIHHLNPIFSLKRGYGIVTDISGRAITSVEDVSVEENLKVFIKDGVLEVKVVNISNEGLFKDEY